MSTSKQNENIQIRTCRLRKLLKFDIQICVKKLDLVTLYIYIYIHICTYIYIFVLDKIEVFEYIKILHGDTLFPESGYIDIQDPLSHPVTLLLNLQLIRNKINSYIFFFLHLFFLKVVCFIRPFKSTPVRFLVMTMEVSFKTVINFSTYIIYSSKHIYYTMTCGGKNEV